MAPMQGSCHGLPVTEGLIPSHKNINSIIYFPPKPRRNGYDEENGWICIGNPQCENGVAVEFAQNTLMVLVNSDLKAIWIKPEFIK